MEFHANTFEEIEEMSKKHGMEMFQKGDKPHLEAMMKIKALMKSPEDIKAWAEGRRRTFDALSHNE